MAKKNAVQKTEKAPKTPKAKTEKELKNAEPKSVFDRSLLKW